MTGTRTLAVTAILATALACGSSDGTGGNGGSGSGGSGGSGAGSIQGGWRPSSIHFTEIITSPFQSIDETVTAPDSYTDPDEGVDLQIVKKIEGNTLTTYTRGVGKDVVLRQSETVTAAGTMYVVQGGTLTMKDGHLVFNFVETIDTGGSASIESVDVTFDPLGTVPPADWPTTYVDLP